nr:calcium-binding protein [uncultured Rhodopila sp.]
MASVTIVGSGSQSIRLSFDATANYALAQKIAQQINQGVAGGKIVTSTDGTVPLAHGVTGAYLQTLPGFVSLPTGYTSDLINVANFGSADVFSFSGAAGQKILSDENTDLTFTAPTGSGTVVAGGGNNQLRVGGPGSWSLNTGSGNDIIAATGSGNNTIEAGGGNNAISLGSGHDLIISVGNDSILGGSGAETVDASGGGKDYVQGGASDLLFVGGSAGATIFGGSGSDTYFGSTGLHVGKQLVVGGSEGNNLLWAGNGAATLIGGGNKDQLFAYGQQNQVLTAASGNETLSAAFSSGNDSLQAGSGSDQLIAGTGADTFVGGRGADTVSAGPGADVYAFIKGHAGGTEFVQGIFDPSAIRISLQGYGPREVAEALASQHVTAGSVTIGLSDGTKITFQNVTALHQTNFV